MSQADLQAAADVGVLPAAAVAALWRHLNTAAGAPPPAAAPRFSFTHTLYYLGGLLAIGAATLFMTEGWRLMGAWGLLGVSLVYAALCVAGSRALHRRGQEIPAGILATLAVCLVPLAVWAVQQGLGLWPEAGPGRAAEFHPRFDRRWLMLELATLAAAAVALWALRYPFLTMPLAVTLWSLGMHLARLIVAPDASLAWEFYRDFSLLFGLVMVLLALWIDVRSHGRGGSGRDYAFWILLLGMLTFWGALTARDPDSEFARAGYALLNIGFVFLGVLLQRRIFTVCGGLGVAIYLGHLSARVFHDSLLFPLALSLIGLGVMASGLLWQRHEARLQAALLRHAPHWLRPWLPAGR